MKKVLIVLLVLGVFAGCRGVTMNAEYSQILDKTATLSQESATRAINGTLTEQEKTDILVHQAGVWQLFKNGRDGVE